MTQSGHHRRLRIYDLPGGALLGKMKAEALNVCTYRKKCTMYSEKEKPYFVANALNISPQYCYNADKNEV